jgi:DNA-binding transcriptional LysR family regulator
MDLRRTDMGLLVSLDALLSERSVTRAAKTLGISQPALSAQLAKLRQLFEDQLLVGNAHGMTPTPRAIEIQEPLHIILRDLQALVMSQKPFDPGTADRTFAITATDYIHATVTRPLLAALPEIAPRVRIAALAFNKDKVRDQLEDGTADLCITAEALTPADFPARKLRHERFVLILSKSHPAARKRMTLDLFCALDHVLASPEGGGFRGVVDAVLSSLGRSRRVVGSLNSFLLAPTIVKSSHCVAVVPEHLALAHGDDLKVVKVPFDLPGFDIFQSWHPRSKSDSGHIWLRDLIVSQVRSTFG